MIDDDTHLYHNLLTAGFGGIMSRTETASSIGRQIDGLINAANKVMDKLPEPVVTDASYTPSQNGHCR